MEELAQQKQIEQRQESSRRVGYQLLIFSFAFLLNFSNNMRQQYIYDYLGCSPSKCKYVSRDQTAYCDSFSYSVTISAGIGFVFLGNIYDNVDSPRRITTLLLFLMALTAAIESIYTEPGLLHPDIKSN